MILGKNIDGLINGGGAFLSPQEIVSKCKNGGGHLFVNVTWDSGNATMDKNYSEILTAFRSGIVPVFITDYDEAGVVFYTLSLLGVAAEGETPYMIQIVQFGDEGNLYLFQSATETGTPTYSGGSD